MSLPGTANALRTPTHDQPPTHPATHRLQVTTILKSTDMRMRMHRQSIRICMCM